MDGAFVTAERNSFLFFCVRRSSGVMVPGTVAPLKEQAKLPMPSLMAALRKLAESWR